MVVSTFAAETRRELLGMIHETGPDATDWFGRLRALRTEREIPAFAEIVRLVLNLDVSEDVAEALVGEVLEHRERVSRALGRDPGFAVAALDLTTHMKYLLHDPVCLDRDVLDPILACGTRREPGAVCAAGRFEAALEDELRRCRRFGGECAVAVVRLDRFATLVTRTGIENALTVLRNVVHDLADTVRDTDVVARLDTDRFVVLFPKTGRLGGYVALERFRSRLHGQPGEHPVTVSAGIAAYPADALDGTRLVHRASRAVRAAVSSGGDRVAQHDAERRRTVRFPAGRATTVTTIPEAGVDVVSGRGLDLGSHGALLEFADPVTAGQEIRIRLEKRRPSGRTDHWESTARIVRTFDWGNQPRTHRVGVEFDEPMTPTDLARFVVGHEIGGSARGGRA